MEDLGPRFDSMGLGRLVERQTLAVASSTPGLTLHAGDGDFLETARGIYSTAENNAAEQLTLLKARLAGKPANEFWTLLMEGMTTLMGAQYAFVTKRVLVHDENSAVEMPPIGEPGSCLMAVAFYFNDGAEKAAHYRDYKYLAFGAPCGHMKHDKVFVIPDRFLNFITDNPNEFAFPVDAYLGVPLFADGKCFAHFGSMWSVEGLEKRQMSWGFLEMLHHALEDIITQRLITGQSFAPAQDTKRQPMVIPQAAVTAVQSLRPYARNLSHELRTPMQGVVGMLDIMHATVQESLEAQPNDEVRNIFAILRENIEVAQDSSRRAVEAADNVVHAYDMDMQVPETPMPATEEESPAEAVETFDSQLIEAGNMISSSLKRRRSQSTGSSTQPKPKHRSIGLAASELRKRSMSPRTALLHSVVEESEQITAASKRRNNSEASGIRSKGPVPQSPVPAGLSRSRVRDLIHAVINESLRIGGRPDSAIAQTTDHGELIEVVTRNPSGESIVKMVEWSVDPSVPEEIILEERDLMKLVSVLFLNAIKFTERGKITLTTTLSPKNRYIVINVRDTGPGIPTSFLPFLFQPFSREDDSLTRQSEGLGLGLLVAKGLARKVGGDLNCLRSHTEGPLRGSEFELRLPLTPSHGSTSRNTTPSRTPTTIRTFERPLTSSPLESSTRKHPSPDKTPTRRLAAGTETTRHREKLASPLSPSSSSRRNSLVQHASHTKERRRSNLPSLHYDRNLAQKHPLTFLVAEDNRLNRKILVNMLAKLGYTTVHEAFDGAEAVRLMISDCEKVGKSGIDVILMDLWMPNMDGYEAAERILAMDRRGSSGGDRADRDDEGGGGRRSQSQGKGGGGGKDPGRVKIMAVTADMKEEACERARAAGMTGFMTKPYKLMDLERLILEHCV